MKVILAIIFVLAFTAEVSAFTCAQVRWAVKNMSPELIASYMVSATKEQIAFGRKCLRVRHNVARRHRR
jgi:hypothetical protein